MLSGFRFRHAVEVRFRDLDALGHVNNAVYLTYLESARMAWWMHVKGRTDLAGLDMILARAEIDYRSPAVFGERLAVGVRCASLKRSSSWSTTTTPRCARRRSRPSCASGSWPRIPTPARSRQRTEPARA
jgi:YbgC/YbaW family acyl-CoA thioester hydrolase